MQIREELDFREDPQSFAAIDIWYEVKRHAVLRKLSGCSEPVHRDVILLGLDPWALTNKNWDMCRFQRDRLKAGIMLLRWVRLLNSEGVYSYKPVELSESAIQLISKYTDAKELRDRVNSIIVNGQATWQL